MRGLVAASQREKAVGDVKDDANSERDRDALRLIQEEGRKDKLATERQDLERKVLDNCRELMKRTVKVNLINKYGKVKFCEFAINATDFCNEVGRGKTLRMPRKKHFVGVGNVTLPLPLERDPEHKV